MTLEENLDLRVEELELSSSSKVRLKAHGFDKVSDFEGVHFPDIYRFMSFEQAKRLLKILLELNIEVHFARPEWTDDEWHQFVEGMIAEGLVDWREVAVATCGALNPPQVGTAIASNASFQAKYPPRQTMQAVMAWFYAQPGYCSDCGTRLSLEADHIVSKQEFSESGRDPGDADTLDNLQLLCKRCNVIKRPSHALGGISFAPAQSTLIWILLAHRPRTKSAFYTLCRDHGLTMASVRFDEAWAFAIWLQKQGKYEIDD